MNLNDDFFVFSSPHPAGDWRQSSGGSAATQGLNHRHSRTESQEAITAPETQSDDVTPHPKPRNCENTNPRATNLGLKLRLQAKELGMTPGSSRWRAYVLGTISAMKKRKRQKAKVNV